MAGDGDDGRVQAGVGVDLADMVRRERIRIRGKVHPMRRHGDGHISAGIDKQLCRRAAKRFKDAAGQSGERKRGEVFFAKLDIVDALSSPVFNLLHQRNLLLFFRAGKRLPVCDRVAEHEDKCMGESCRNNSRNPDVIA